MLRPNFVREQVSDLEMEERHMQNMMKVLPIQADGWTQETDIQPLFFRLTIDSATEFLFGSHGEALSSYRSLLASQSKEYKENNRVVNEFLEHYVNLALQRTASEKKTEEGRHEKYVFLEALAEQTRDPYELRSQLLNILLAGRDTTASLLSWLFHQLLRNPHVFTKLRGVVLDTFGTYDDPQDITFATLKGCQYLQYCLNETLRLWTVVPGNARRSNKATTLPRGGGPDGKDPIYIKPQTDVNYSIHVMHRRKDIWGPDADEFKPERFIGRKPGWEYLPFNGGPRICIGQQFALTKAAYVVVRLLQRFDAIEPGAQELEGPVTSNLTLTSCPGKPVTLRLHRDPA